MHCRSRNVKRCLGKRRKVSCALRRAKQLTPVYACDWAWNFQKATPHPAVPRIGSVLGTGARGAIQSENRSSPMQRNPRLESWDLAKPALAERSQLYALSPIGIGTPLVESLTGYISRLATVHAVSVTDLVGRVLARFAPANSPIISE